MSEMALLRLIITMNKAYTNAEAIEYHTPKGLIDSEPAPPVMMTTPPNVAAIESHTGHDGTTFRKTMMIATSTGNRNTSVVTNPEAMYLYDSKRKVLLAVNNIPRANRTPACFRVILKLSLLIIKKVPSSRTAMEYLKKRMASVEAPAFINGFANSGFNPYVIPVIMSHGYPIIAFRLSFDISVMFIKDIKKP